MGHNWGFCSLPRAVQRYYLVSDTRALVTQPLLPVIHAVIQIRTVKGNAWSPIPVPCFITERTWHLGTGSVGDKVCTSS